ncbi:hypothetical protein [Suipraeoptans intestinalis]|uniref:hypothetical protein n=1 Tax=Suipraeoptans intestinalis TaxID=2606628 RepID=UPI0015666376|nr:hypothetical protein [Suipraeoptans intestinalis]
MEHERGRVEQTDRYKKKFILKIEKRGGEKKDEKNQADRNTSAGFADLFAAGIPVICGRIATNSGKANGND